MNELISSPTTNKRKAGEGREGTKLLPGEDERTERRKSRRETSHEAADSRTSGSLCFPNEPQPVNI